MNNKSIITKAHRHNTNTPYLYIDLNQITSNYNRLKNSLPNTTIHYAIKSNNDANLIRHLNRIGSSFDVASLAEIKLALKSGSKSRKIIFSAPVKKSTEIKKAYNLGIRTFAFDSKEELEKLSKYAPSSEVILRIMVESEGSQCPMFNKFGVYIDEAVTFLLKAKELGLKPIGLTFHVGSQCLSADSWINALFRANKVWEEAHSKNIKLSVMNLGGGLPVSYDQIAPPIEQHTRVIKRELKKNFHGLKKTIIEPGRYMTDQAAIMVASVIGKATRGDTEWIYLDVGGFNGLFEIFENFDYEIKTIHPNRKKVDYAVAGPTCDGMDIIRKHVYLPEVNIGEKVFILNAGAYSISIRNYNGIAWPKTITIHD